jgi:tripartite ATP-independent transporter DctM subunit
VEWPFILLLLFGSLLILMATGMPIAFCFMLINVVGVFLFFGGTAGLEQLILSIYTSLATFVLLPVLLFILMGELTFQSGLATDIINVVDKWLGRLPGRLALLSVGAGALLSALTGASMASTSMLGSVLTPEMEKRDYQKPMSLGPIMGSGGLAIMIPPSSLAVLLGAIGELSIGKILVAIIVPGILMAGLYVVYIIVRCYLQPSIAPVYETPSTPLSEKIIATAKYVLPIGFIFFLVVGVIFIGVATPSEAAASGTIGVFIVMIFYRRLKWQVLKQSVSDTLKISGMVLLIIAGAQAFSQILSFSGASQGLAEVATSLPVAPIFIVITMQIIILIMGGFMEVVSIMMITLPIFVPTILALGFDPIWFAALVLLNIEMAMITPPFGLSLFVMKGVAPPDTTIGDIYRSALPFIGCNLIAMALIIIFPQIALWAPRLMMR